MLPCNLQGASIMITLTLATQSGHGLGSECALVHRGAIIVDDPFTRSVCLNDPFELASCFAVESPRRLQRLFMRHQACLIYDCPTPCLPLRHQLLSAPYISATHPRVSAEDSAHNSSYPSTPLRWCARSLLSNLRYS